MGNTYTLNAAESSEIPAPPPIGSPPVPVDPAPPSSQTILSAVSNNPGVFEDLHKKCKGIFLNFNNTCFKFQFICLLLNPIENTPNIIRNF